MSQKDCRPAREMEYIPNEYGGYYVAARKRRAVICGETEPTHTADIDDVAGHRDGRNQ